MGKKTDLVQPQSSTVEALPAEVFGDGVKVEHCLVNLINGVHRVKRWQFLSREQLFRGFDHALSVVVTQLHTGADHRAAKPLAQNLKNINIICGCKLKTCPE